MTSSEKLQRMIEENVQMKIIPEYDIEYYLKGKYEQIEIACKKNFQENHVREIMAQVRMIIDADRSLYESCISLLSGEWEKERTTAIANDNEKEKEVSINLCLSSIMNYYDPDQRAVIVLAVNWFTNLLVRKNYQVSYKKDQYISPDSGEIIYLHTIIVKI